MNKNTILKISALLPAIFIASSVAVSPVYAKEVCYTQYGGGETCVNVPEDSNLELDKTIYNPSSKQYEDHVKSSGGSYPYIFDVNEDIKFKITIKNAGDVELKNVDLKDELPYLLRYSSGDGKGEDSDKRVEFDIDDLKPGDEKTVTFNAKIDTDGISPDDNMICLTNVSKAEAKRVDNNDKEEAVDYSNFCIALGKVLAKETPKVLPVTGSDELLFGIFGLGFALVGYGLKKFVS